MQSCPPGRRTTRQTAASLVLAATLAACATTPATVSEQDLDFVTYATAIIRFDREEGKLAGQESKNPAVLAAATEMTRDADATAARLNAAAAHAGIKPPKALPSDLRVRLAHMRLQPDADFDRNYVNDQLYSHENNLAGLEDEAANGTVPELKALAQTAVPIVRANIARLRPLQLTLLM